MLNELRGLLPRLEDDLRAQAGAAGERLRGRYAEAQARGRTGESYETWLEGFVTQVAVAWVLSTLFVRFLEDNGLVEAPWIAGPGERGRRAEDRRSLYFRQHPVHSDRQYLEHVLGEMRRLPGAGELFADTNPVWLLSPSGDACQRLVEFWREVDAATGALRRDFSRTRHDTRFLGDVYQDLSEAARKRYALVQTPDFVERFILDRTLEPAVEQFGLAGLRVVDPSCGSGHFLLGAFQRVLTKWLQSEPGTPVRDLAQRALDSVLGMDLNPFAAAIARFRLLVAALNAADVTGLGDAPAFRVHVAVGDALLFGLAQQDMYTQAWDDALSGLEDAAAIRAVFGQRAHVVVANPPYITPKDATLNDRYRKLYRSCHRQYSLGVPFTELCFELAVDGGYVGMITANSFMKREFGKKLIEEVLPKVDVTHVIDTSGAYIPGHGTPTVILFGRNRKPRAEMPVRAVLGIRGEPSTPEDPVHGRVWSSIRYHVDGVGYEDEFVSVVNVERARFESHPWSMGGGGAADLKEALDAVCDTRLADLIGDVGFGAVTREDDAYLLGRATLQRHGISARHIRPLVAGESVRNWAISDATEALWPYSPETLASEEPRPVAMLLWPMRSRLSVRVAFGKSQIERGLRWTEYSMFFANRFRVPLTIAFPFVATHNHFLLDRGGNVFNRTAPVVKLPSAATEQDHHALVGLLNSAAACFWMKQVFYPKAGSGIGRGIQPEGWMDRYEFDGTKLQTFPVTPSRDDAVPHARALDALATTLGTLEQTAGLPTATGTEADHRALRANMVALQEELDWLVYSLYGLTRGEPLTHADPPPLQLGERAFEIALARRVAGGEVETAWFERHGSTPRTDLPAHWPADYRAVVEARLRLIETDRDIRLIEQPEYKRRWQSTPWSDLVRRNTHQWLLDRLETPRYTRDASPTLLTIADLAHTAAADPDFLAVAAVYTGRDDFDVTALVADLVTAESVPDLPILRYAPAGLRKHAEWKRTWDLQREEDATGTTLEIPVPPAYTSADFASATYWRLRGKLDVPKERFVAHPYARRDTDAHAPVTWAGLDHLQRAEALVAAYTDRKEREGFTTERLVPFLAALAELVPWLLQWHNEPNAYGDRMGDVYRNFLEDERRALKLGDRDIADWAPPKKTRGRKARA